MTMDKDSPVARSEIRFGDGEVFHLPTTDNKNAMTIGIELTAPADPLVGATRFDAARGGLLVYDGNVWKRDEMGNNPQSQILQGSLPTGNPHQPYHWVGEPPEPPPLFEPTGVPEVDALAKALADFALEEDDLALIQEHLDKAAEAVQAVTRREVEKVKREAAEELARIKDRTIREVKKARDDALADLITQHTTEMRVGSLNVITATITDVPITPDMVERIRNRITGIGT